MRKEFFLPKEIRLNREQRRRFNKQNGTHFTRVEFAAMEAAYKMKKGALSYDDAREINKQFGEDVIVLDNEELVPEGFPVMLNADRILERKDGTPEFKKWVKENRDKVFHVTREGRTGSLVCLYEDKQVVEEHPDGTVTGKPQWMFDIYNDLLYRDTLTDEWVMLDTFSENIKSTLVDNAE